MANSIIAGNDFRLIIRAKKSTGAYLADMDLADVEDLRIYLTRAGRSKVLQSYTLDDEGHAVIYVSAGVVTNATYGIEMVGVYGGARLRAHNTSVFTISGHGGGNSGVLNDYYADIVFVINVAATDVYVQNAIEAHNEDEASHPHLLQLIEDAGDVNDVQIDGESIVDENKIAKIDSSRFGKVDDVKVNGTSVVSNKEANITIPEKVSDLPNDADYATQSELTTGLDAKQDTITAVAEPTIADDGGNPSASVDFEGGELAFAFRNLKLRFSDLTAADKAELKGDKGDQGDSAVYDPSSPDAPDFEMANTTGQSTTKAMTQKAVTDELNIDRTYDDRKTVKASDYIIVKNGSFYSVVSGSGVWTNTGNTTSSTSVLLPVVAGHTYEVSRTEESGFHAFFVTNNSHADGTTPSLAGGLTEVPGWFVGTKIMVAPVDAKYMYVRVNSENVDKSPVIKDITTTKNYLSELDSRTSAKTAIDISNVPVLKNGSYNAVIGGSNTWVNISGADHASKLIPVAPGRVYELTRNEDAGFHAFFLASSDHANGTSPDYAGGITDFPVWIIGTALMTAPSDAAFLYIRSRASGDKTPSVKLITTAEVKNSTMEAISPLKLAWITDDGYSGASPSTMSTIDYIDVGDKKIVYLTTDIDAIQDIISTAAMTVMNIACYDSVYKCLGTTGAKTVTENPTRFDLLNGTQYIKLILSIRDSTSTAISIGDDLAAINSALSTIIHYSCEANASVMYSGEQMLNVSLNHKFGLGTKTIKEGSSSYAQGMAIYGKYIVLLVETKYDIYEIQGNRLVKLYSLLSRDVSGSDNHGNSCQFVGNVADGEIFPYLYVAECLNKLCHVQSIKTVGATVLQTIAMSSDVPLVGSASFANLFMGDDGYVYAATTNTELAPTKLYVVKFRNVLVSEGDVTLDTEDVIDYFEIDIPDMLTAAAIQGNKVYNGYIYVQFGGSVATKQILYKIDLTTHKIVSRIDFYGFATEEVEDFDFDFANRMMYTNVIGNFFIKTQL